MDKSGLAPHEPLENSSLALTAMISLLRILLVATWILGLSSDTQAVPAAVTVYGVSAFSQTDFDLLLPTPVVSESVSVSAAGIGADGATTYIEEFVYSIVAIEYPTTTLTTSMPLFTNTFVVEESAGGFQESLSGPGKDLVFQLQSTGELHASLASEIGQNDACTFDADGLATCVGTVKPGPSDAGLPFTFSGTVIPIYTLAATPTSSSAATCTASRTLSFIFTALVFSVTHGQL